MPNARDRLIETARTLFYARGYPSTGINDITDAAGVARMSLYNNFKSKKALASAAFEAESAERRSAIQTAQADVSSARTRVLCLFDVTYEIAANARFRGCAFSNLALESAAPASALHALAKRHKDWVRGNIEAQLGGMDTRDAQLLAAQIAVLWDGASLGAYIHQSPDPIDAAKQAAITLLDAAGVE